MVSNVVLAEAQAIEDKILHILSIYPIISPTMLQGALGPSVKPALWRPVLQELIDNGIVNEENEPRQTPNNRHNSYTKLSRAPYDE